MAQAARTREDEVGLVLDAADERALERAAAVLEMLADQQSRPPKEAKADARAAKRLRRMLREGETDLFALLP